MKINSNEKFENDSVRQSAKVFVGLGKQSQRFRNDRTVSRRHQSSRVTARLLFARRSSSFNGWFLFIIPRVVTQIMMLGIPVTGYRGIIVRGLTGARILKENGYANASSRKKLQRRTVIWLAAAAILRRHERGRNVRGSLSLDTRVISFVRGSVCYDFFKPSSIQ